MARCVLAMLLVTGCGRVGFDAAERGAATEVDAGADAVADTAPDPACSGLLLTGDVAFYTFETGAAADATGVHPGSARAGATTSSDARCGGGALQLTAGGYVIVPDAPAFDLATGSVELFFRTPSATGAANQSILARDANGLLMPGHLSLLLSASTGELILRIQRSTSYYRCAPAPPPDTWVHVGFSFGGDASRGMRMWVDGVEATLATAMLDTTAVTCTGTPGAGGLAGNDNALVIGASNANEPESSTDPVVDQHFTGAIDQLRIRSTWRDFSAP